MRMKTRVNLAFYTLMNEPSKQKSNSLCLKDRRNNLRCMLLLPKNWRLSQLHEFCDECRNYANVDARDDGNCTRRPFHPFFGAFEVGMPEFLLFRNRNLHNQGNKISQTTKCGYRIFSEPASCATREQWP